MQPVPVLPAGAVPPWFAHEWRHCGLRPLRAGRTDLRPGASFVRAGHDHWTLYAVHRGRIDLTTSGGAYGARAGESWLVPPVRAVRDTVATGGAVVWAVQFDVLPAPAWRNPLERLDLPRPVADLDAEAWAALAAAFVDWKPRDLDALLRARAPLERVVTGHLLAGFAGGAFAGRAHAAATWLEDLAFWLCSLALRRRLGMADIAAHAGYCASHVTHAFSRAYGMGPMAFLRQERIRVAARLLREKRDEPVAAIAKRCGYRDRSLFCRHFRALLGSSPRAWRRHGGAPDAAASAPAAPPPAAGRPGPPRRGR